MSASSRVQVALIFLVFISLAGNAYLIYTTETLNDEITAVEQELDIIADELLAVSEGGEVSSNTSDGELVAYDTSDERGTLFSYEYQPLPGDSIYVSAGSVDVESDFQQSLRTIQPAIESTDYEIGTRGFALKVDTPDDWEYLSGQSAGLALAVEMAATHPDYERNESVALTGEITEDGSVERVNHVGAKSNAVEEGGYEVFVIPHTNTASSTGNVDVHRVYDLEDALDLALDSA